MGAGRQTKTDTIDPAVGIMLHVKTGDTVKSGMTLATLHIRKQDQGRAEEWAQAVRSAYEIDANATPPTTANSLIWEVIESSEL